MPGKINENKLYQVVVVVAVEAVIALAVVVVT